MTKEEGKEFANALKNNYTIDFDKLSEFCDLVISALEKNESAGEWYKLLCEKWDSAENCFDGMTNGEVICSVFDVMVLTIKDGKVWVEKIYFPFDEEWWNAPYQKGGE